MIKTSFSTLVGGGDFGLVDGIAHYITIQVGSFTMVCQGGMPECIPIGEKITTTTCGGARGGTTTQYLTVMFEPTGKPGMTQAIINRIGAPLVATVTGRRPVGTIGAFHKRQATNGLQWLLPRLLRRQRVDRLQRLFSRLLILVRIKMPLQGCTEEAMHKSTATVVSKAARACPQRGRAGGAKAMLAMEMLAVPINKG
jgi:hypothetical protein